MLRRVLFAVLVVSAMGTRMGMLYGEEKDTIDKPFFANEIEVTPGGKLMLHPRLPYVEGLQDGNYKLVLNVPYAIKLSRMSIFDTDRTDRVEAAEEACKELVMDGERRMELSYKPDFSTAIPGMRLQIHYDNKTESPYVPTINFIGTFDWRTFRKEIRIPDDNTRIQLLLLKWAYDPVQEGTLYFKSLKISDRKSRETVFNFSSQDPIVMRLGAEQATCLLSEDRAKSGWGGSTPDNWIKLTPGGEYVIECEAKASGIKNKVSATLKDAMLKKTLYARTFLFDVDPGISLPSKLQWRIEGDNGSVHSSGEVKLTISGKRIAPKTIDSSAWICETQLRHESPDVQRLYVSKLFSWGANTIEPQMRFPKYGVPLNEDSLSIPIANEAKRLGMRVRTYLGFINQHGTGFDYLKANPQFAAIDPLGKKAQINVCPTHYLDSESPWLKYYLDVIKESVKMNKLDGVFYDFEYNAAPYRRHAFGNRVLPDAPRKWNNPCMCECCRKVFQSSAGLDRLPSVEDCCGDELYEKWTDFRCGQNVKTWELIKLAAKAANPNATLGIYSGQADKYTRETYGVDWTMGAHCMDFGMLRRFSPFPLDLAEELKAALAKGVGKDGVQPKMLFQIGAFAYHDQPESACRAYKELVNLKADIVRAVAACESFGWSFNGIWGMDDQLGKPIREANALLAQYEDYFVAGSKVDSLFNATASGNVEVATWRNGNRKASFVFNRGETAQDVILKMDGREAKLAVGAHDCCVYEWLAE